MQNTDYRAFVLDIYQAVTHPSLWPEVLNRISETVSAKGCIVFEWQGYGASRQLTAPHFTTNYDRDAVENYLQRNRESEKKDQDTFERKSLEADGIELVTEEVLYLSEADYLARPHVREMRKFGIRYRTGALLDKDNPFRARFSLQLGEERGVLTDEDRGKLGDLLPHVAKAMDLGRSFASKEFEQQGLLKIIDRLNVGICLLNPQGGVTLRNAEFDRQCQEFGAFAIDRAGYLRLHAQVDHSQYSRLLGDALNHGRHGARPRKEAVIVTSQERAAALCIEVVPLDKSEDIGSSRINGTLLISLDTTRPIDIDMHLVGKVYNDLTKAELAVIDLICQGLTNSEIAYRRDRSVETINTQVKAILGKSRASNRTQLVRLLSNFSW